MQNNAGRSKLALFLILGTAVLSPSFLNGPPIGAQALDEDGRPVVCQNRDLMEAVRIIDRACTDISCDFRALRELDSKVDKPTLLAALRDPYVQPVHLFFPENVSALERSFDWRSGKKEQLSSLSSMTNQENAALFVIGRASHTGNFEHNKRLSRQRMTSVMDYIKENLGLKCKKFRGAWLGKEIMQLSDSDARFLNLEPKDYRDDLLVLNQSVHIFVFPCADLLD